MTHDPQPPGVVSETPAQRQLRLLKHTRDQHTRHGLAPLPNLDLQIRALEAYALLEEVGWGRLGALAVTCDYHMPSGAHPHLGCIWTKYEGAEIANLLRALARTLTQEP